MGGKGEVVCIKNTRGHVSVSDGGNWGHANRQAALNASSPQHLQPCQLTEQQEEVNTFSLFLSFLSVFIKPLFIPHKEKDARLHCCCIIHQSCFPLVTVAAKLLKLSAGGG